VDKRELAILEFLMIEHDVTRARDVLAAICAALAFLEKEAKGAPPVSIPAASSRNRKDARDSVAA
jgi:hypothetical protein